MVSLLVNLGVLRMDDGQHSSLPFSTGTTSRKSPSSFSITSLPEVLLFPRDSLLSASLTQEVLCTQLREAIRLCTIRTERVRELLTPPPPSISSVLVSDPRCWLLHHIKHHDDELGLSVLGEEESEV